jgi:methylase of polypeptide subunit release factors
VCLRRVAHYEQQIVRDAPLVAQTALVIPTTTLGSRYIATDVNPAAVASTERTAAENGVDGVRAIRSDLVTAVADDIAGRVDVLLFNPPYVVTPSSEVGTADIAAAWAGGTNGREVTDRLLPLVPTLLTPETGRFYLVAIEENLQHDAIGESGLGLASGRFVSLARRVAFVHCEHAWSARCPA